MEPCSIADEDVLAVDMDMYEDEENYRCVELDNESDHFDFFRDNKNPRKLEPKNPRKPSPPPTVLPFISQEEVGSCWLPLVGPCLALFEAVTEFLDDNLITYAQPRNSEFVGFLFQDFRYAFFQIVFYYREEDKMPALKVTRLSGDGFLTSDMFKGLREYLVSQELICEENAPWTKDVDDEDYEYIEGSLSDNEDMEIEDEEELPMELPNHLQLKYDTGMIDFWLDDLLENEYFDQQLNTMMSMAHNTEIEENVQLMMEHSDGKLFEGINKVMEDSKSFPMVRSCAKTVENIMNNSDANVSWPLVKTMCDSLLFWSENTENKKFSYNQPIRNSQEIQTTLASSLTHFVEKFNEDNANEVPEYMKESIDEVQMWLENERSVCCPEARENLEYFVQNVTPILGY
jgi:hypothetical protein